MPTGRSSAVESRALRRVAGVVVGAAAFGTIGVPLLDLTRELAGAGWDSIGDSIGSSRVISAVINTAWTSLVATAITLGLATVLALGTAAVQGRRRVGVLVLMAAPLLVPPFVSALSWQAAYGDGGLLDDVTGVALPGLVGPVGVVALLVVGAMPMAFLILAASLGTRSEHDLIRAARVSGASAATTLRTVVLPLLRPALVAAGAVTFITSANAFGVPAVLGTPAGFGTATTTLYQDLVRSADPAAFDRVLMLAAFLAVVTIVVVGLGDSSVRSTIRVRVEPSGPRAGSKASGSLAAATVWFAATTAVPFVALVLTSVTQAVGLRPTPSNWTLDNYSEAFRGGAGSAFVTSLAVASLAATIVLVLGGLLVALERRRRSGMGTLAALGFAIPGSVVAVAVLLAYGPWLRDTVLILLVAYVAKFWALGHRPLAGAADGLSPELAGAARAAGASPGVAVRTIVWPVLRPAMAVAWLAVFLYGLHELTISSLLHGPGLETLAVAVLDLQQLGDPTVTSALAVALTLGTGLVFIPLARAWRQGGGAR